MPSGSEIGMQPKGLCAPELLVCIHNIPISSKFVDNLIRKKPPDFRRNKPNVNTGGASSKAWRACPSPTCTNLRHSRLYRQHRLRLDKTRPTPTAIGERRQPDPRGRPGYVRVDTVHSPEQDGTKGAYTINLVDQVTQWQVLGCVERISEHYLAPLLQQLLAQFPFEIRGFHSDNGSEFINHTTAALLEKLRIEFTKSRARRSNDKRPRRNQERRRRAQVDGLPVPALPGH